MFINIIRQLKCIANSRWYWLSFIILGLAMLAVALFHQHVLNDQPCVMCIQVRLWVTLLVIVSAIGLFTRNSTMVNAAAHISVVIIAVGLTERSYQLLGTERGFVFGDCGFDIGLPAWFAVEEWLPWLYRVETSCGYTPEIIIGITMAEGLMLLSVCMLLISLCVSLASFMRVRN